MNVSSRSYNRMIMNASVMRKGLPRMKRALYSAQKNAEEAYDTFQKTIESYAAPSAPWKVTSFVRDIASSYSQAETATLLLNKTTRMIGDALNVVA